MVRGFRGSCFSSDSSCTIAADLIDGKGRSRPKRAGVTAVEELDEAYPRGRELTSVVA
jgi:hypothetical protein